MKINILTDTKKVQFSLLIIGMLLLTFSYGRWCVSFAAWVAPVFLLRYARLQKSWIGLFTLFLLITLSTGIMLWGIIPSLLGILTYILIVYYAVLWWLPYLSDKWLSNKFNGFESTLIFPVTAVTLEYVNNIFFGSWASIAYSQFNQLPLIQLASIFGIWGITFIVMWFASVINWAIDHDFKWNKIRIGVMIYLTILSLALLYGGVRLEVFPPQSKSVTVASFTATEATRKYFDEMNKKGYSSSISMARDDRASQAILLDSLYTEVFARNKQLIHPNVSIVLWPEGGIKVLEEEESNFIERGKNLAQDENIYLLLAYLVIPQDNPEINADNKSVFINPSGIVEWEYTKTHPVPGSPNKPGNGKLPISKTSFGKISASICYDMDFTSLIHQAGKKNVDIMLVPAWDWKAIDPLHARMAVYRAIENGFSMVRQTGEGLSIAVDYQGRTLATMDHFNSEDHSMYSVIPTKGVKTIYGLIGDSFAWLCILAFVGIVGWTVKGKIS